MNEVKTAERTNTLARLRRAELRVAGCRASLRDATAGDEAYETGRALASVGGLAKELFDARCKARGIDRPLAAVAQAEAELISARLAHETACAAEARRVAKHKTMISGGLDGRRI